jgi:hypothetical protein
MFTSFHQGEAIPRVRPEKLAKALLAAKERKAIFYTGF